jgi:hypothetical protein
LRGAADGFPIELFVEYDDGQGFFNIGFLTGFGVLGYIDARS